MKSSKVYIIQTKDLQRVATKALEIIEHVVISERRGKKILLKPNVVGPYLPTKGVTTHPEVISCMRQILLSNGYEVMIGDCPGESSGPAKTIFERTGVIQASGEQFINLGAKATVVPFACRPSKKIAIADAALQADIVVSMAKLKTSCYMMFSGAVKNNYGIIPGTQKAQIHNELPGRDEFADMLIDLTAIPKRLITIIDGGILMEGNGPVHGKLREANVYIIAENVFAADFALAKLLGLKINEVPVLKQAQKRGLLVPEQIEIIADVALPLPNVTLPITLDSYREETASETVDERVEHIASVKITIDEVKCIKCGHCANICPAQAMQMKPYPEIDHEKCIRCFCCNELCTEGAAYPEQDIKQLWDVIMGGESKSSA